jgi:hypothetical protein
VYLLVLIKRIAEVKVDIKVYQSEFLPKVDVGGLDWWLGGGRNVIWAGSSE